MRVFCGLLAAILVGVFVSVAVHSLSQNTPPQAPSGETISGQQSEPHALSGSLAAEATEYWTLFGRKLKITDTLLAIFTLFLVMVGIGQAYYLDGTLKATKRSADAVVSIELPFLVLGRDTHLFSQGQGVSVGVPLPSESYPLISFINVGRSNAEITKECIEWSVADKLPPIPEYQNIVPYAPGTVLSNNADIRLNTRCEIKLAPAQIDEIDRGQKKLWVFGFIGFKDFVGGPHEVGFCLKWVPHPKDRPGGFVYDDDTPPAYTRRT
jgi:hypothetical protein